MPTCKPKAGVHDTLNQWKSTNSLDLWPNDFRVDKPFISSYAMLSMELETKNEP